MTIPSLQAALASASGLPVDTPQISAPVWNVLIGVGSILGAGVLVLTFAKLWMDVLGRRTATVNIQAHSDLEDKDGALPKVAVIDVTGFVATKEFADHKEEVRLRTVGLEKQISDSRHEWRQELNAVLLAAKVRDETTEEWRDDISDKMAVNGERLASVETSSELILGMLRNLDAKVDRHNERRSQAA